MNDETDGSEEAFWSLDQTLNWIAFRRPSSAEHESRQFRLYRALVLGPRDHEGLVVSNPGRILKLRLEEGRISAHGRDGSKLPPAYWAHRSFDKTDWPKIVFKKDDVLTAFPATEAEGVSQPPPARPSLERITAEIRAVYVAAQSRTPPMNKQTAREAIESKYGRISEKEWDAAFTEAGVRGKSGRPRKVPQKSV